MFSKILKEKQITQRTLAKKLHISQSAVSQWNNGCTPKYEQLPKLAEVLNCSIEELVYAIIETKQTYTSKLNKKSKLGG